MKYKFEVGDQVKVIEWGRGFGPDRFGEVFTVIDKGSYRVGPGYIVESLDGDRYIHPIRNDLVGEESFELFKKREPVNGEEMEALVDGRWAQATYIGLSATKKKEVVQNKHNKLLYADEVRFLTPKTHTLTLDGTSCEISEDSFKELKKLINKISN